MIPRTKSAFWTLFAASLALLSIPSITVLETLTDYWRMIENTDAAVVRPTVTRSLAHPDRIHPELAGEEEGLHFVEFSLRAPSAGRVELAADFTHWEKSPVPLRPAGSGLWEITVPLPAGTYRYRFLVDGQPQLDPSQPQVEGSKGRPASLRRVP